MKVKLNTTNGNSYSYSQQIIYSVSLIYLIYYSSFLNANYKPTKYLMHHKSHIKLFININICFINFKNDCCTSFVGLQQVDTINIIMNRSYCSINRVVKLQPGTYRARMHRLL